MKGVGAEADAVAGILAGNAENIRLAVAILRRAIILLTDTDVFGDSCFAAIFFY